MESWRCADQRYYVSDTRKFKAATGWSPKVNAQARRGAALPLADGIARLIRRSTELTAEGGSMRF